MEDIDSVDIVASALDDFADGKITWDEVDMRLHDKRYHPHGYKEGDTCKYRDGSLDIKKDTPVAIEHYNSIGEDISLEKTEEWLKNNVVSGIVYATSDDELAKGGFHFLDAMNLADWGKPASQEIHEENIKLFYSVASDLVARFPKIPLMRPILTSWVMNNIEYYRAISTPDKRDENRTNYIALGDYYTGNRKSLDKYHIVRHEIGHSIATFGVLEAWEELANRFQSMEAFLEYARVQISEYAGMDIEETIAESFAIYTAPDYKQGSLPDPVESLVLKMLNGDISRYRERSFAMDAANVKQEREGIEPVDPAYYPIIDTFIPEKEGEIRWLDNKKGMLTFSSYEERFRHILGVFKVPDEWIDALCRQHPNNKWSIMTAKFAVHIYRNTNTPLDRFLKKTETFFAEKGMS